MSQNLNLKINKPCSEKFENFTPAKEGGFCQSCQKEVIDFTLMTDREIFRYFENRKGKTCGRFAQSQLKAYSMIIPPKPNRKFAFFSAGLIGFSLASILPFSTIHAQHLAESTEVYISEKSETESLKEEIHSDPDRTVEGIVLDRQGSPMVGCSILIKGTTKGIFSNEEGKFKLVHPFKEGDVLIVSYVGFETKKFIIPNNDSMIIKMTMEFKACDMSIMGEVAVSPTYSSKSSFWQRFKNIFN